MTGAFLQGFGVGGGLIIAIGAQNAFVLSQGIKKNYPLVIAAICILCDATLIAIGVGGVGTAVAANSLLSGIATWGGAIFLFWFGLNSLRSALKGGTLESSEEVSIPLKQIVMATFAITLLNPHVYFDTIVLLGSISGQFPEGERLIFGAGAITASIIWFLSLALGARLLSPVFKKQISWKILDMFVCLTMWGIALSLVLNS
ncbi:MAG: amino acid transporter [Desulfocapsa sp.]|nr:amino acid transporter [Desulfocapsa sp.]